MSVEVVRYRPQLRGALVQLQTHHWSPSTDFNASYLAWKYERNPYLQTQLIHLALCDGQVVGMRGMFGARWEAGPSSETFLAPLAGDTVVAPDHRNHGVLARIIQAAADDLADSGIGCALNLSARAATQLGSLMSGWRSLGAVEIATRRRTRTAGDGVADERPDPFAVLDECAVRDGAGPVSIARTPRPQEMARLIERIEGDGRIRHVRDTTYFGWRFGNPLARYRFLFREGSELEGYMVLHHYSRRPGALLTIVDWEAATAAARADLLGAAIRWGGSNAIRLWSASLSAETKALLESHGFAFSDSLPSVGRAFREGTIRQTLLVRAAHPRNAREWAVSGRRLLDLADWDLRALYSDGF